MFRITVFQHYLLELLVSALICFKLYEKLFQNLKNAKLIINNSCYYLVITNVWCNVCRALKTKSNTPKYGLIFHSTFIGRAQKQNKGRMSRYIANKCSIASRIDCFQGK